jgi:hypothetical protein
MDDLGAGRHHGRAHRVHVRHLDAEIGLYGCRGIVD